MALKKLVSQKIEPDCVTRHKRPNGHELDQNRKDSVKILFWDLAHLFGKQTTIHGVNRALGEKGGCYERALWFLTVILAFAGSIYVCIILSRRFNEGKFQTVVDTTHMPVYKIPFPVVTICNKNRLNWSLIAEAKQKFLPNETNREKLELFERIVSTFDNIKFGSFDDFSILEGEPLELLNHINFSLVFDFMTWRCEEFLEDCSWQYKKMNCCEIFSKRHSKIGLCWSFNSLETDEGRRMAILDPTWPWRTGIAGPGSALRVRAFLNSEKHHPNSKRQKGLNVMITEPLVWHSDPLRITENSETMIQLEPVAFFFENETKRISSDQRKCVFNDERNSADFKSLQNYVYMNENCEAECHQEYMMRFCNCSMDLLFPPGQYPPCRAKDLICLARNNDQFVYTHTPGESEFVQRHTAGMICKCYRNCYSLKYSPDTRINYLPPEMRQNLSYVDLDVHFRFDAFLIYRTSLIFDWIDLLVAFGGIAGLFLGCSLISAIEVVFFISIETPKFIIEHMRRQRRQCSQSQVEGHPRLGGFAQRHMTDGGTKLERLFYLNNAIMAKVEESRYEGIPSDHFVA